MALARTPASVMGVVVSTPAALVLGMAIGAILAAPLAAPLAVYLLDRSLRKVEW